MTTEEHTNGSAAAAAAQHDEPNTADQHDDEDWKSGLAKPVADDRYRTEDVTQTKVSKHMLHTSSQPTSSKPAQIVA
jgi:hypothetical protein